MAIDYLLPISTLFLGHGYWLFVVYINAVSKTIVAWGIQLENSLQKSFVGQCFQQNLLFQYFYLVFWLQLIQGPIMEQNFLLLL